MSFLFAAPSAPGFDTGPHGDLTLDAMRAEGFNASAAAVGRINDWFVDMYTQAANNPFSGSADPEIVLAGGAVGNSEDWSPALIRAVARLHFDPTDDRGQTAGMEAEWNRLRRVVFLMLRHAKANHNPLLVLTTLGASLHEVQDFYTHTNWAEPRNPVASEGPGWEHRSQGLTPTWFDVPPDVRAGVRIYSGGSPDTFRKHGSWAEAQSTSLNKDWPGRPNYDRAYMSSYFASRQWIRSLRVWLADDALWASAQHWATHLNDLDYDIAGAVAMSTYSGHQYGEGGICKPGTGCTEESGLGGSVLALRQATKHYFEDKDRTLYRRTFERNMYGMGILDPQGVGQNQIPVKSSRSMQAATRFVRLRFPRVRGIDLGDIGADQAELYARAVIGGQPFVSAIIQGRDSFVFPQPYYPFTFIKAVPRAGSYSPPVSTMTVRIETSSSRFAGTDDDVFLRISPTLRFALDKGVYNDFERGDSDTYSVPIDAATRRGLSLEDFKFVQIEKSRDGAAGGWKLAGVELKVDGRTLVAQSGIGRWLEDDHRTWRTEIARDHRGGPALGVWFDLLDDDTFPNGADDQGDVNPYDARDAFLQAYIPGTHVNRSLTGGNALAGRLGLGGDKAALRYEIDTLDTQLPQPPALSPDPTPTPTPTTTPTPPPAAEKPDLVITALSSFKFTVKNQGLGVAGAFSVAVDGYPAVAFSGLAAGESATRDISNQCTAGMLTGRADSLSEVDESDEANNTKTVNIGC